MLIVILTNSELLRVEPKLNSFGFFVLDFFVSVALARPSNEVSIPV